MHHSQEWAWKGQQTPDCFCSVFVKVRKTDPVCKPLALVYFQIVSIFLAKRPRAPTRLYVPESSAVALIWGIL